MEDRKIFIFSLLFPFLFVSLIWLVKIIEVTHGLNLVYFGLFPRRITGLAGIITAPLIHADFKHLFDNSVPAFLLSLAVFYFYRPVGIRVFLLAYLVTGICVWLGARPAYHIGASGLVYSLASFLFFSGVIRKNTNLLAISLLVVFLYGGLVWGIFPFDFKVSWESHLFGALTGLWLAFAYRRYGPPPTRREWDDEEDEDETDVPAA